MSGFAAMLAVPVRLANVSRRRARQVLRALAIGSWIGVGVLLFAVVRLLLPWRPVSGCLKPFMRPWMQVACVLIGVRVSCAGRPPIAGQLLVANHVSWLDIVTIAAQQPLRFVAKTDVRDWPVIGLLASAAGTLFLQRGKREGADSSQAMREQIAVALAAGESVLIFPEGTTSEGHNVRRFHARLLPGRWSVSPVALAYLGGGAAAVPFVGDDDFASSLWRVLAEPDLHAHLQYLPTVEAGEPEWQARRAQRCVSEALGLLATVSEQGAATVVPSSQGDTVAAGLLMADTVG